MTGNDQVPLAERESRNVRWSVDPERKLLFIELRGGVSDYDMLRDIPQIWKECPDIVWFNVIVDALEDRGEGNWTWGALQQIAKEWKDFEQQRNPNKRVAILTDNYWITQLVNRAFGYIFSGERFRCFEDRDAAAAWATSSSADAAD